MKLIRIDEITGTLLKGSDKLIIFTHGLMDNRMQYPILELSYMFYKKGFSTFRFDFRGCGESFYPQEKYSIRSMKEDLEKVLDYFEDKFDEIFLVAKSISTIPALMLKRVKTVFLAIPFEIQRNVSEEELKVARDKGYIFFEGKKYGYDLLLDYLEIGPKISDLIKEFNIESIAIYGSEDKYLSEAKKYLPTKYIKLEVIEGEDHSYKKKENSINKLFDIILNFIEIN